MPPRKILVLTASSTDAERIRTDREMQTIQERLQQAAQRNRFSVVFRCAQPGKLLAVIEDEQPEIVHFSGHSTPEGLFFEDESGNNSQLIPTTVLALVFSHVRGIRCVLLNACHSDVHARAISQYVPYTIGMEGAILDKSAIAFSEAFYRGLGRGKSIESAFKRGYINALLCSPNEAPKLFRRNTPGFIAISLSLCQYLFLTTLEISRRLGNWLNSFLPSRRSFRFLSTAISIILAILIAGFILDALMNHETPGNSAVPAPRMSFGEKILLEDEGGNCNLSPPLLQNFNDAKEEGRRQMEQAMGSTQSKQLSYTKAAEQFDKALGECRNAPETRIYYNNANIGWEEAWTIAVVVPATESSDNAPGRASAMLRGFAQAQETFNAEASRSDGKKLRLLIIDDLDDPDTAKKIASDLVAEKHKYVAVVGHWTSNTSLAAAPIYSNGKLVFITPISITEKLAGYTYVYRVNATSKEGAGALAGYIRTAFLGNSSSPRKVIVFYDSQNEYSNELKLNFIKEVRAVQKSFGDELFFQFFRYFDPVVKQTVDLSSEADLSKFIDQTDFNQLKNEGVILALFPAFKSLDQALRVAETSKNNLPMLGDMANLYSTRTLEKGDFTQDMVLAPSWNVDCDPNSSFARESRRFWAIDENKGWVVDVNWATAMSYNAVQAVLQALRDSPDPQTIREKLDGDIFVGADRQRFRFYKGDADTKVWLVKVDRSISLSSPYKFVPIKLIDGGQCQN